MQKVATAVRRAAKSPGRRSKPAAAITVRFWGVRGSLPSPGPATQRYGGNTPCLEVRCGEQRLVFDLGSGARALGDAMVAEGAPVQASIFLSHYHYDHLQGLPFFVPIFDPRNRFNVFGADRDGRTVRQVVEGQMVAPYFPVTAQEVFRAGLEYARVGEDAPVQLGDVRVRALELNHPGGNLGYRVEHAGRVLVYATDVEHGEGMDQRLAEFARGADVLIYDAMYTEDEYRGVKGPPKLGWGHSTWQAAIKAADAAGAKTLVLFHHDPKRDDAGVDRMLRQVRRHRPEAVAAAEALVLSI